MNPKCHYFPRQRNKYEQKLVSFLTGEWKWSIKAEIDYLRFRFMVAGCTKFASDCLFAQVANSNNQKMCLLLQNFKQ